MSYINQNNMQGAKPYQNKTDYGTNGSGYRGIYPVQGNEDSMRNYEPSSLYENNNSCNRGGQDKYGGNKDNCNCNNPTPYPPKPCGCTHECQCNKPTPKPDDCDNSCAPVNNCCNGQKCKFDSNKAKCVCTFMDVIFDEEIANGTTVFQFITATVPNFIITSEFTQSGQCCNACAVDSTSVFTVDSVRTTIKSLVLQDPTSVTLTNVLIGGRPAISVTPDNGGFSAVVDPSVLDAACNCKNEGTNSNVLITGLSDWNYIARHELCGKVTTGGTVCNFKITAENSPTIPGTIPDALTFVASDVCLPENTDSGEVRINVDFTGKGQLVNPVITAAGGPPPLPVTLTVSGNLVLNTLAELTVLKNSRVCIQGMVQ